MRAVALVAFALAPLAASAQVSERLADLRLATAVRLALVDDVRTRALDVEARAERGAVTLAGDVSPRDRRTVAEVAGRVPGVRRLDGLGTLAEPAAGPVVTVPDRRAPAEAAGPVYHTVQRGDTLFALARRYDTTVSALLALNGRQSTGIRVGQRLRVR